MFSSVLIINFLQLLAFVLGFALMPDIRIERISGTCSGKTTAMKTFINVTKRETNVFHANATIKVSKDLNNPKLESTVKIVRCRSQENLDTCEDFLNTRPMDYCKMMEPPPGEITLGYYEFTPPLRCPVRKGSYSVYNKKIDLRLFVTFPIGDWYWKATSKVFDPATQEVVSCLRVEGGKMRSRSKK